MSMAPADYALLSIGVASGLCVAAGYGMIALSPSRAGAIRGSFWTAAIGFGSMGIVWGIWGADPQQSLTMRLAVAGITGAVSAVALTWALWQIRDDIGVERHQPAVIDERGRGGDASVEGNRSGAIGGSAGESGLWPGGRGGDARVRGDNSFSRGGDGGNAPRFDGRGGPRTKSPGERMNLSTEMWPYGYGGHGANKPEYNRRLKILSQIRTEYMKVFPDDAIFIEAGVDVVPISWVNKRLEELQEDWRVNFVDGGYELPPLPQTP